MANAKKAGAKAPAIPDASAFTSLLGEAAGPPPTPEEAAALERRRLHREWVLGIARYIIDRLCDGYAAGEIPFRTFCERCHDALAVDEIDGFMRQKLLGSRVEFALGSTPPTLRRGQLARPMWLAETSYKLVSDVNRHEGLPIVNAHPTQTTAYERAAQLLRERGIRNATAVSVRKGREQWAKHTAKR